MIYILKAGERYKIGITTGKVETRIKALQTGCPDPIEVVHTYNTNNRYIIEQELHKQYKHKNTNGEWFELTIEEIEEIVRGIPKRDKEIKEDEEIYLADKEEALTPKYKTGDIVEIKRIINIYNKPSNKNEVVLISSEDKPIGKKIKKEIVKITGINNVFGFVSYIYDHEMQILESEITREMNQLKGTIRKILYW